MSSILLLPAVISICGGLVLLIRSWMDTLGKTKKSVAVRKVHIFSGVILTFSVLLTWILILGSDVSVTLFRLVDDIPIYFHLDDIGRIFAGTLSIVWMLSFIYSLSYMKHEGKETRYFGFYLLLYGVLTALDFSGNLITMYLCYELMTLAALPLILHNGSREAIMASLKYLFYSMCGAYFGLFGIFTLYHYTDSMNFTAGGTLRTDLVAGHESFLLLAIFFMILGFGVKAGMFPFHAWLPSAHPVAPSPASAVLSGMIVKAGVLALIRSIYYIVGPDFVRGTWVQTAWLTLSLITVFMGSMLAFREKVLKKRLAYSTVSQVSYILFGLAVLTPEGFAGALLQVVAHAFVKTGLFLVAGVFLYGYGFTRVEQLVGIGKKQRTVLWSFVFLSLSLVGIPPTGGFLAKWYLALGALDSGISLFNYLGPAVLLVSALLTAGYLFPLFMRGFLPGENFDEKSIRPMEGKNEERITICMKLPIVCLAALGVLVGVFPTHILSLIGKIAAGIF